jgi:hypothetical protein
MSTVRPGQPGATRVCPHCKAIVLESAAVCPGCRHHLRFSSAGNLDGAVDGYRALSVDGTIAHRHTGEPCEYCIVLDITNERGERLVRQVVGVGALQPGEQRRLNVSVDMLPIGVPASKAAAATAAAPAQPQATMRAPPPARGPSPAAPAAATAAPRASLQPPPVRAATAAAAAAPAALRPAPATAVPAAKSPPAPGAAPKTLAPGTVGALGQRLRIFRKP